MFSSFPVMFSSPGLEIICPCSGYLQDVRWTSSLISSRSLYVPSFCVEVFLGILLLKQIIHYINFTFLLLKRHHPNSLNASLTTAPSTQFHQLDRSAVPVTNLCGLKGRRQLHTSCGHIYLF